MSLGGATGVVGKGGRDAYSGGREFGAVMRGGGRMAAVSAGFGAGSGGSAEIPSRTDVFAPVRGSGSARAPPAVRRAISSVSAATISPRTAGGILSFAAVLVTASFSVWIQSASLCPSVPHNLTRECLVTPPTVTSMIVSNLCASQFCSSCCSCAGGEPPGVLSPAARAAGAAISASAKITIVAALPSRESDNLFGKSRE